MNNNTFIQSLTTNLEPVKPSLSPNLLTALWLAGSLVVLALAAVFIWPVRGDAWTLITSNLRFATELATVVIAIILLALAAFRSAIPGEHYRTPARWGFVLTGAWFIQYLVGFWLPTKSEPIPLEEHFCWYFIVGYALIFFLPAMYFCLRLYPLKPMRTGFYCSLAAGLIPVAYMHVACAYSIPHIFTSHILPFAIVAVFTTVMTVFWAGAKRNKKS